MKKKIANSPENNNINGRDELTQEKQNIILSDLITYKLDEDNDNLLNQKKIQNINTIKGKNENENALRKSLVKILYTNGKDGHIRESNENKMDDDESKDNKDNEIISLNNNETKVENEIEERESKDSFNEDNKKEKEGTNIEEKLNDKNIDFKSQNIKSLNNNNNQSNKPRDSFDINNSIGIKIFNPEKTPIGSNDFNEKEEKIDKDKENKIQETNNEMGQEVKEEGEKMDEEKNKENNKIFIYDKKEKKEVKSQSYDSNKKNNETKINLNTNVIEKNEETEKEKSSKKEEYDDNTINKNIIEQKQYPQNLEFKNNYGKEVKSSLIKNDENTGKISLIKDKTLPNNIYDNLIQKMINKAQKLKNKINVKETCIPTNYKNILDEYCKELENEVAKFKLRYIKKKKKKHYTKDKNKRIQIVNDSNLAKKRNDVKKIFKELISLLQNKLELPNQKYYYLIIIKLLMKYKDISKDDFKRFIKPQKIKKFDFENPSNKWIKGHKFKTSAGFRALALIIPLFYIVNYIYANIKAQM